MYSYARCERRITDDTARSFSPSHGVRWYDKNKGSPFKWRTTRRTEPAARCSMKKKILGIFVRRWHVECVVTSALKNAPIVGRV